MMRFIVRLLLALSLCVSCAHAQMGSFFPGPGTAHSTGGGSPTFTNFNAQQNSSCGFVTTCNVTGVTVASGFNVVAAFTNNGSGSAVTVAGVTLCGTALTLQGSSTSLVGGGTTVALFYGTVVGGSCTAAVTSSASGAITRAGVAVGLLSNLSSTTPGTGCIGSLQPSSDNNYACSSGITVSGGGFGVAAIGYNNVTTMTSTNLTIGVGAQVNAANISVGIAYTTTSNTPVFQGATGVQGGIVAAPWN